MSKQKNRDYLFVDDEYDYVGDGSMYGTLEEAKAHAEYIVAEADVDTVNVFVKVGECVLSNKSNWTAFK